jgi:hypothetical protein
MCSGFLRISISADTRRLHLPILICAGAQMKNRIALMFVFMLVTVVGCAGTQQSKTIDSRNGVKEPLALNVTWKPNPNLESKISVPPQQILPDFHSQKTRRLASQIADPLLSEFERNAAKKLQQEINRSSLLGSKVAELVLLPIATSVNLPEGGRYIEVRVIVYSPEVPSQEIWTTEIVAFGAYVKPDSVLLQNFIERIQSELKTAGISAK